MEGRIEIVTEKAFKIEKVFKIFKIEKLSKIIAQYFDLITTNQIDSCALYFWLHMTQHMTCPIALYRNTAGNGHQKTERLPQWCNLRSSTADHSTQG